MLPRADCRIDCGNVWVVVLVPFFFASVSWMIGSEVAHCLDLNFFSCVM